ncbi:hypothetical protein ACJJTC_010453 [Scirpophaga incertulas]
MNSMCWLCLLFICNTMALSGEIWKPCPYNSLSCIRKYFSQHGVCKQRCDYNPDVLNLTSAVVVPYPTAEITSLYQHITYIGLRGNINNFFINPKTNNAVLTVEFPDIRLETDQVTLFFHRLGCEPWTTTDCGTVKCKKIFVTAAIPNPYNLQMANAFITSFTYDAKPSYSFGPKIMNDSFSKKPLLAFLSNIPDDIQQLLSILMPFALQMFVKYNICDFNLSPGSRIIRPCPDYSLSCVQKYFTDNAQCTVPILDAPYTITYPFPWKIVYGSSNTTIIYSRLDFITSCISILDFFINPATDKAVLTVQFFDLTAFANHFDIYFHRMGQEPARMSTNGTFLFYPIIVTATIPNVRNLQMRNAFFATVCVNGLASYTLGPKVMYDVNTQFYFDQYIADLQNRSQHFLYYIMAFVFKAFVKYNICDFDIYSIRV